MKRLAPIAGVVLAGGRSSRLGGGHKTAALLGGSTLLERVVERFAPQVDLLLINSNGSAALPPGLDGIVIPDTVEGYPGPLAGLVAACDYLRKHAIEAGAIALVPCDGPFLPLDLVARLATAVAGEHTDAACCRYEGELQPTFSLWRRSAEAAVTGELRQRGRGGFKGLFNRLPTSVVDWPASTINPFFNINSPGDLDLAGRLLAASPPAGAVD